MKNLNDALIDQVKDLYSAETQLVEALPKMVKAAEHRELKRAFEEHLGETKEQVKRLKQISKILGEPLEGHTCKAMQGLIKEAAETINEDYETPGLKDVALVAAAQRVEHYEIAGYGNAIALAEYLEEDQVVELLEQTIEEEGNADKALTSICQTRLFDACDVAEARHMDEGMHSAR